jgi:hypothetical protein
MVVPFEEFPAISPMFFLPLSQPLKSWLDSLNIYKGDLPDTYGAALCFPMPQGSVYSITNGGDGGGIIRLMNNISVCKPTFALGALIMLNDLIQFPLDTFWHLSHQDYSAMRALIIIRSLTLGTPSHDTELGKPYRPISTACPGHLDGYASNVPFFYQKPAWNGTAFNGTLCNLVSFMGDLHDKMIAYINVPDPDTMRYTISAIQQLQSYFDIIQLDKVLNSLSEVLCVRTTITTAATTTAATTTPSSASIPPSAS